LSRYCFNQFDQIAAIMFYRAAQNHYSVNRMLISLIDLPITFQSQMCRIAAVKLMRATNV